VSEGFGLPPIEALACGCVVFSSLNHALADNLDPGVLGHQLGAGTLTADCDRIRAAVQEPQAWRPHPDALEQLLHTTSEQALAQRWRSTLEQLNHHWDRIAAGEPPLLLSSRAGLGLQRLRQRLANRIAGLALDLQLRR
jgi:hypothetical protein